jgi:phosphoribosylaminoimidazolecarboxamide formyltransferase/IMP cyclohydrolase
VSASVPTIRRALLSVSDKRGLLELGRALAGAGIEILSTGGTCRALAEQGIPVVDVSTHTGFPEIMGGRVKTLHPRIHGGILARAGEDDEAARTHDLPPIDLVVVNLYPFAETIARPGCTLDEAIENIDIGGPAMLRAAAKNHDRVSVVCSPDDYAALIAALPSAPGPERRRALATRAFAHTAAYDGQISQWLAAYHESAAEVQAEAGPPPLINLALDRIGPLRYGENPHQQAALYAERDREPRGLAGARLLQGKPLSYNNLLDADAAWSGVRALGERAGCVIVKHTNPCGAAVGADLAEAYDRALACDPTSAFGGIVAVNRPLDGATAERLAARFVEVIIAPGFESAALEALAAKTGLRLLVPAASDASDLELRRIDGGWLVQTIDRLDDPRSAFGVVTQRKPTDAEWRDLDLAWAVVAMVRSNAIVLARDGATIGIGAGQMSRVDASRIAVMKAADQGLATAGAALASDAFFPFADGLEAAAAAGVRAVIQPGGSKRDDEVIAAADAHDIAMVFTGRRHFRH